MLKTKIQIAIQTYFKLSNNLHAETQIKTQMRLKPYKENKQKKEKFHRHEHMQEIQNRQMDRQGRY